MSFSHWVITSTKEVFGDPSTAQWLFESSGGSFTVVSSTGPLWASYVTKRVILVQLGSGLRLRVKAHRCVVLVGGLRLVEGVACLRSRVRMVSCGAFILVLVLRNITVNSVVHQFLYRLFSLGRQML